MGTSNFSGPLAAGPRQYPEGSNPGNQGYAVLSQTVLLTQNSTTDVSATVNLPKNSQIVSIIVDPVVQWNSATSASLTIGTAAAGTQYSSGIDVKAATTRTLPTFTIAQLTAMADIGTTEAVVATVDVTGATSAGSTRVTYLYVQKPSLFAPG